MEGLANTDTTPVDAAVPATLEDAASLPSDTASASATKGPLSTLALLMVVLSLVLAVVRYKTAESHNDMRQQLGQLNSRGAMPPTPPGLAALQSSSAGFVLLLQKVSSASLTDVDCATAPEAYARFVEARNGMAAELDSRAAQLDPNAYLAMNGQLVQVALAAAHAIDEVKQACQALGLPVGGP